MYITNNSWDIARLAPPYALDVIYNTYPNPSDDAYMGWTCLDLYYKLTSL